MKKIVAKRWINALRSGEYKQGTGTLYNINTNSYCCLGVLKKIENLQESEPNFLYDSYKKVGLKTGVGEIYGNIWDMHTYNQSSYISLTNLNDNGLEHDNLYNLTKKFTREPFTFDEIADIIQIEYVEGI
tara:strand:+ start:521 stop:910 length:390 start_codon:yes stop_codon:yes gene_type:complete